MSDLAIRVLTKIEAAALTERIRESAEQTWSLLLEAHEGQAWHALGYTTWADYVATEFGMSRTRAYELVSNGQTIRALAQAAGVSDASDIADLTEREHRAIKPVLPEVLDELRDRTEGLGRDEVVEELRKVVREVKDRQADELAERRARFHKKYEENPHLLPKFTPTVPCPNCDGSGRLPKENA